MARFIRECVRDVMLFVDRTLNGFHRWPPHGFVPCLAIAEPAFLEKDTVKRETSKSNRLSELFDIDWGILWGTPRSKTPRPRKFAKRFSPHRVFVPKRNLVACQQCGAWHEIHTICGECYKKVREETEVIKRRLLAYNPSKGELPDKEAFLVYQGETPPNSRTSPDFFGNEQRIVEIDKPRPSWFSADLKKRWQNLAPFVYEKPNEKD